MIHAIGIDVGTFYFKSVIMGESGKVLKTNYVLHHGAPWKAMLEWLNGLVLNERSDRFQIGNHTITLRVMGIFELADGKITAWRDYFDMNQYMSQLPQKDS